MNFIKGLFNILVPVKIPPRPERKVLVFDPTKNVNLTLHDNVVRTASTDVVICKLDKTFIEQNHRADVSSILREPQDQLRIILQYAKSFGILAPFTQTDVDVKISVGDFESKYGVKLELPLSKEFKLFIWQYTWSKLLASGIIINPAKEAICLCKYVSPSGENKLGKIISASPHFSGNCFDIEARSDKDPSLTLDIVVSIVDMAIKQDPGIGITGYTIERKQNCLHVNVKSLA